MIVTSARGQLLPKMYPNPSFRAPKAGACDGAVFVSNPLQGVCGRLLEDKPTAVIPSAASEDVFFFDECLRARSRQKLGYSADHRVFVFSGGMQPYQCLDRTVEIFHKLIAEDVTARLLIMTPNVPASIRALQSRSQGYIRVIEAAYHEVNSYLNAADAGFLLKRLQSALVILVKIRMDERRSRPAPSGTHQLFGEGLLPPRGVLRGLSDLPPELSEPQVLPEVDAYRQVPGEKAQTLPKLLQGAAVEQPANHHLGLGGELREQELPQLRGELDRALHQA